MALYKVISTITWQFESEGNPDESLQQARDQLDQIVNCSPQGKTYEDFNIQLDLNPMKRRNKLQHLQEFPVDEILSLVTPFDRKHKFIVNNDAYFVRLNSDRYYLFKQNTDCVVCGLKGSKMFLDVNPIDQYAHFNLYGEENGRLVLMTKDHILPKSKGGKDDLSNYQTMCSICNNLKGNYDLILSDILELRKLAENKDKLPKKTSKK